jgi:hypothetical protein
MQKIITRFQQLDLPNYTTEELSVELNTPINIIQKSLDDLIFCQLLTQLTDVQTSYQPSRSIELLNEAEIINALENKGENYQISSENK